MIKHSSQVIRTDPKFITEYTVVIRIWDKTNIKLYNHYNNLGNLKLTDDDGLFCFERTFDNMQDAISFFIVQQEVYDVDVVVICEYCYDGKVVASEYIETIDVALRAIADQTYLAHTKSLNATIENLKVQLEILKPVLELPMKEIEKVIDFANRYMERSVS